MLMVSLILCNLGLIMLSTKNLTLKILREHGMFTGMLPTFFDLNVWVNFLVFVAAAVGLLLLTFERLFQLKRFSVFGTKNNSTNS